MVVVLTLFHIVDRWTRHLKLEAGSSFNFAPYLSGMTATKLAAAILLMALMWQVLIRSQSGWIIRAVYLQTGLTIISLPFLVFVLRFSLPFGLVTLFPESLLWDASAFVAVMGLVLLIKIGWGNGT